MDEAGVSHGVKQREAAPQSNDASSGLWAQLTLALVGGACLDLPNHECTHDTTHMMVGLHHHPDLLPLQGQLTPLLHRAKIALRSEGHYP